jgi:hypothetical protein
VFSSIDGCPDILEKKLQIKGVLAIEKRRRRRKKNRKV